MRDDTRISLCVYGLFTWCIVEQRHFLSENVRHSGARHDAHVGGEIVGQNGPKLRHYRET